MIDNEELFWRSVGEYFAEAANSNGTQRKLVSAMQEARRRIPTVDDFSPTIIDNVCFQLLRG